jgi:hypothetical protein
MCALFCRRQRERKLDVFFSAKKAQDFCRGEVTGAFSGEEVSVSLVYALGLWTDQTPPIRASKWKHCRKKRQTKWVPKMVNNLGKQNVK